LRKMEFLRTIIELNRDIIYFVYGLVFFVLGLAIALQSRNYSRLDFARSLKWLSAFGFSHGFHEWGDLFIPIQEVYLSPFTVEFLHYLHLVLLALSYAFLFQFGVALLDPLVKRNPLRGVSTAIFIIWVGISFAVLPVIVRDHDLWHNVSNGLARYFIGFPGGLLSAYALRKHTMQRIHPLDVPHIVKVLRFGGIMLAFYAIFGGLIPPPLPFFPGNIINSVTFENFLAVPPPVFRSIVGLGLALSIIRALEIFDVETARMIENIEQSQILTAERNRIARDLHDGAIQKVYTAGLLVESANKLVGEKQEMLSSRLMKAESVLNDAIRDLRINLSELNPTPVQDDLLAELQRITEDPRLSSLINISLDLTEVEDPIRLSPMRIEHVLAVIQEALANVIRHSRAKKVHISISHEEDRIQVHIHDNGIGLPKKIEAGFGLRNMRDRARLLGGALKIDSDNGKGTHVVLDIPSVDER
jgi:signal transduction histidine kinase